MRSSLRSWHGRDFVLLSAEGPSGSDAAAATGQLLAAFSQELESQGASLDDTVRTRLWATDRESRNLASAQRRKVLSGRARSASSSYIAPQVFASDARIAIDLQALKPPAARAPAPKVVAEFDPPRVPVKYVIYDSFVFLSGVTVVLPTLADQVEAIVSQIGESLHEAGTSWRKVIEACCYLHRSQSLEGFRRLIGQRVGVEIPQTQYALVDGYSAEGKLVEIEVTGLV